MGTTQQFSLRWNNYLRHIKGAFDALRTDGDLVDVTLSCEGQKIRAHKMLLSACSTYFRDLFKENPCQHPVIIFKDVKFVDLKALIDFIYQGEVNVVQDQLSSFLLTAELLAVQGLSDGSNKDGPETSNTVPRNNVPSTPEQPEFHPKPSTSRAHTTRQPVSRQTTQSKDLVLNDSTSSSNVQSDQDSFLQSNLPVDSLEEVDDEEDAFHIDLKADCAEEVRTTPNPPSHAQTTLKKEVAMLRADLDSLHKRAANYITAEEAKELKLKEIILQEKEKRLKKLELGQKRQERFRRKRKMEITKLLANNPQLKAEVPSLREKRGRPRREEGQSD
ncbi:protein tramtrack, beta isoform isoform X3 [Nilaparvata lugens]|uniref:protein tramtrack, beta isoform isoform X3 n=1 Tax=Nilaparvata lugens TaxID=108931 RepID=UPI00193CB869|nr:protein tramtrack, beta isoform isoform X3 [Nilaparvata lugens]